MKKILFIEDERALQKTFTKMLEKEGYKVISALDGKKGVKTAKEKKPDLILLDLILPKLHGFDVLKELRKIGETKETPVIVLTNLEGLKDVEKALELGAKTYLVKANYSLDEIASKIEKVLEQTI